MVYYTETLITNNTDNKFVVNSYMNGELIKNEVTDIDYVSNSVLQEEIDYIQEASAEYNQSGEIHAAGIPEVTLCISTVLLVDLTVARIIATTCIAACATIVPICVACIGVVAALGGANIPALLSCWDRL